MGLSELGTIGFGVKKRLDAQAAAKVETNVFLTRAAA